MKKFALILAAAFLVTGVAFADGGKKKKEKTSCNKHEGKTCSKKDMQKEEKKDDKTPAAAPGNQ